VDQLSNLPFLLSNQLIIQHFLHPLECEGRRDWILPHYLQNIVCLEPRLKFLEAFFEVQEPIPVELVQSLYDLLSFTLNLKGLLVGGLAPHERINSCIVERRREGCT